MHWKNPLRVDFADYILLILSLHHIYTMQTQWKVINHRSILMDLDKCAGPYYHCNMFDIIIQLIIMFDIHKIWVTIKIHSFKKLNV